jgi:hypothetical protein
MAKRNRSTLRNYFHQGARPSAEHFADLIDSSLNMLDQGFDKTAEDGFKISSLEENAKLMTFYRKTDPKQTLWSISYDCNIDSLLFCNNSASQSHTKGSSETDTAEPTSTVLSMTQEGFVGINTRSPSQALEVNGVIKSSGRLGTNLGDKYAIPADGQWHNITTRLEGCQTLEVVAGVGIKRSGRYGMLHAIAMNTCQPSKSWLNIFNWRNPIKSQSAFYHSSADRLKLRWVNAPQNDDNNEANRPYYLQIKSSTNYGADIYIRYHLTQLWFDAYMHDSVAPDLEKGGGGDQQ